MKSPGYISGRYITRQVQSDERIVFRKLRIQGTVLTSGITFVNPCIQHFQS